MRYLAALDVGTTTIRCHILDEAANNVSVCFEKDVGMSLIAQFKPVQKRRLNYAQSLEKFKDLITTLARSVFLFTRKQLYLQELQLMELLYPKPGYVEIDPDWLWDTIVRVVKQAIKESGVDPSKIETLGISTQRCSVISWNRESGKPYHNFITWKDLRADPLVKNWNSSLTMQTLRLGSKLLYTISQSKRFQAGSVLRLMNNQMTLRLLWALQNVEGLRAAATNGSAIFGGVDCWLLYKLTGKHVTDVSSASASGMFDPYTMSWAGWAQQIFSLPGKMFPKVVDTVGDFGRTSASVFGAEIPITCLMADQAASLFGSGCIKPGDLKLTMGTGSFINVNTGSNVHTLSAGLYPLVGWRIGSNISYVLEGLSNDNGTVIEWAKSSELIQDPLETTTLANSVKNSDGVYFIPAFSGLQGPINDENAAAGFIGVKPTTQKAHLVRSMLESLVFRVLMIYERLQREMKFSYKHIKVDGGVSKNDFIMQLLADLTGLEVERSTSSEMSILGVAFLAGLQQGIWKNNEDVIKLRQVGKIFYPNKERQAEYEPVIEDWKRAIERFTGWY